MPYDDSYATALNNGNLFNATVNVLEPGDTLLIPADRNFYLTGNFIHLFNYFYFI